MHSPCTWYALVVCSLCTIVPATICPHRHAPFHAPCQVLQVDEASKAWRAAKGVECSREDCYPEALRQVLAQKHAFQQ